MIVVRKDLSPGQCAVQCGHAAIDFIFEFPDIARHWHNTSNYLIFLEIENESELEGLIAKCRLNFLKVTEFREPDLGDSLTAIAIEPSDITQKLTKKLNLLLK